MDARFVPLRAFTAAGAHLPHRFEEIVKDAHEAGGREDLLLAVDGAPLFVSLPAPVHHDLQRGWPLPSPARR